MENIVESNAERSDSPPTDNGREFLSLDAASVSSPVIARLIEEVRNEEYSVQRGYNRFHNRHNR